MKLFKLFAFVPAVINLLIPIFAQLFVGFFVLLQLLGISLCHPYDVRAICQFFPHSDEFIVDD